MQTDPQQRGGTPSDLLLTSSKTKTPHHLRYKRFLADIVLSIEDGCCSAAPASSAVAEVPTVVHCPNTGSMEGLLDR